MTSSAGNGDHFVRHLRSGQFLDRTPGVAAQEVVQVALEHLAPDAAPGHAQSVKLIGKPGAVLPCDGQPDAQQRPLQLLVQAAHHAEVDQGDRAIRADEEVARVRVGVEETELEHLAQHDAHGVPGQRPAVYSSFFQGRYVGNLDPLHAFDGQDAVGSELPVDARDGDPRIAGKIPPEALGVVRLPAVVQLVAQCVGELVHQRGEVVVAPESRVRRGPLGHLEENLQIALDLFGDAGPLDLDDHRLPVLRLGGVSLADGGHSKRQRVEGRKEMVRPFAKLVVHHLANLLKWHWRSSVLQL
jgi:hypothetical protein